jgi:protein subunit release factor B
MLTINERIAIPLSEFEFSFARSPGPGGQHVNKVNTKAVLRWSIEESVSLPEAVKQRMIDKYANRITKDGVLVVQSHRHSQRPRNIDDCLAKIRLMVLIGGPTAQGTQTDSHLPGGKTAKTRIQTPTVKEKAIQKTTPIRRLSHATAVGKGVFCLPTPLWTVGLTAATVTP